MPGPAVTVIMRDYDYLAALYGGDVQPDGVQLTIDRKTPITQWMSDPNIMVSEVSFSRFIIGLSKGDRSFVGIPFHPTRAFRHRCFFVTRGSSLRGLADLEGKRVGTNSWPDTGNTWTRAALRDQGVRIDRIRWWVGPLDETYPVRAQSGLPPYVREAPPGKVLRDSLLAGDLDALMCPFPPKGFYEPQGQIVRLLADYQRAEREYYDRTKIFPIHHIVAMRREMFERNPEVAVAIYRALDQARLYWQKQRLFMAELTPWVLGDLESTISVMGGDWQPSGVSANRHIIKALCDEEIAQGLIDHPVDPASIFAEFDALLKT